MSMLNRQAGLPIRSDLSERGYSDLHLSNQCFIHAQRLKIMLPARTQRLSDLSYRKEERSSLSTFAQEHFNPACNTGVAFVQVDPCFIIVDKSFLSQIPL